MLRDSTCLTGEDVPGKRLFGDDVLKACREQPTGFLWTKRAYHVTRLPTKGCPFCSEHVRDLCL